MAPDGKARVDVARKVTAKALTGRVPWPGRDGTGQPSPSAARTAVALGLDPGPRDAPVTAVPQAAKLPSEPPDLLRTDTKQHGCLRGVEVMP